MARLLLARRGRGKREYGPAMGLAFEIQRPLELEAECVGEHRFRHCPKGLEKPKVLRLLMREGDDEFSRSHAGVFDSVDHARRNEKHFAGLDRECVAHAVVRNDSDKRFATEAKSEFVGICMPMRLTHGLAGKHQAPN
jgi:hypothetical protein